MLEARMLARAPPNHREHWPWQVESRAGAGLPGLVPRGRIFENRIFDRVEPRRSGLYEFCVVGVDLSQLPERVGYYCWEPTGHFDRIFTADEVEKRFALEHFGRSVALKQRATGSVEEAHSKNVVGLGAVVRWPAQSSTDGLVHGRLLPSVDENGRPFTTLVCRFPPRNSADLVSPLMHRVRSMQSSCIVRDQLPIERRLLILDSTGRVAARIAGEEEPGTEVVAVDDPPRPSKAVLKHLRDKAIYPVDVSRFDQRGPSMLFADGEFNVVLLPFVFHRVCVGDDERYMLLIREALRVASDHVVLAEDVVSAGTTDICFRRWKSKLIGNMSVQILLDGELRGGRVPDHFLSQSGVEECTRRFLVLDASFAHLEGLPNSPAPRRPPDTTSRVEAALHPRDA